VYKSQVAFEDLYWMQEAYYSDVRTGRRLRDGDVKATHRAGGRVRWPR